MKIDEIPGNDEIKNYSRELLIEIVMAQKEQIIKLLKENTELKIKLDSYTNMRNTEIKPIVISQSNRKDDSK